MAEPAHTDLREDFERMVRETRRALADDRPAEDEDDLLRDEDFRRHREKRPN